MMGSSSIGESVRFRRNLNFLHSAVVMDLGDFPADGA